MKRGLGILLLWASMLLSTPYSGEFFREEYDARVSSIGGEQVAVVNFGGIYNPALLSLQNFRGISLSHSSAFNALVSWDFVGYQDGRNSNYGYSISFVYAGGGGIPLVAIGDSTLEPSAQNRPYKVGEKSHAGLIGFVSYGKKISDKSSLGGTIKVGYQKLVTLKGYSVGADWGAYYSPGSGFGLALRVENLVPNVIHWNDGKNEYSYPSLFAGTTYEKDLTKLQVKMLFAATGEYLIEENDFSPHLGFELTYHSVISARVGYNRESYTLGAGIQFSRYSVSALLKEHSLLETSYKISLIIRF